MANATQAQEPSMEEILASIRRIISDEETPPADADASAASEDVAGDGGEEMSQDDLDKLFDSDGDMELDVVEPEAPAVEEPETEAEPAAEAEAEAEADDVLELTEDLALAEPEDDLELVDIAPEPEVEPEPIAEEPVDAIVEPVMAAATEELLSPGANQAVQSAFNDLASTILSNNARTLEDLVKEMLRPMLKTWLDQNLPPMVERLVRQEIERVSRGR